MCVCVWLCGSVAVRLHIAVALCFPPRPARRRDLAEATNKQINRSNSKCTPRDPKDSRGATPGNLFQQKPGSLSQDLQVFALAQEE